MKVEQWQAMTAEERREWRQARRRERERERARAREAAEPSRKLIGPRGPVEYVPDLLTAEEEAQAHKIHRKLYPGKKRRGARIVWQDPGPSRYDLADLEACRDAIWPMTELDDGTRGRWLRDEIPDVDRRFVGQQLSL
jgi:hypothetical protein